eukprot:comp18930_c0_seq1/m.34752 comp18930_c0_seq1/g.34752  ORF comp18930_c0_seq1/g.34752 comp18930_c0_seq1/m.34752 type:complete len:313 (-) comp18930_c0_seq1:386-1324(-)
MGLELLVDVHDELLDLFRAAVKRKPCHKLETLQQECAVLLEWIREKPQSLWQLLVWIAFRDGLEGNHGALNPDLQQNQIVVLDKPLKHGLARLEEQLENRRALIHRASNLHQLAKIVHLVLADAVAVARLEPLQPLGDALHLHPVQILDQLVLFHACVAGLSARAVVAGFFLVVARVVVLAVAIRLAAASLAPLVAVFPRLLLALPAANHARTRWCAAVAGLGIVSVCLELVVEAQLGSARNVLARKQSDAPLAIHQPFLRLQIRLTAVVEKARDGSALTRVDRQSFVQLHKVKMRHLKLTVQVFAQLKFRL